MKRPLGVFQGNELADGTLAFFPVVAGYDQEGLQVRRYNLPVTPPASDWYVAQFHNTDGHTGLDINLREYPRGDVDLGQPVYATCNGLVLFAGLARGTSWGNLVITTSIEPQNSGTLLFWRYAHLREVMVDAGRIVRAATLIGTIGKGYSNRYAAHLHLDCWRGQMIAPESWRSHWVNWIDPLKVWSDAGYNWEFGDA